MNIALDIDGVIVDFVSSFIPVLKEEYNYDLKSEDVYCHDISQVLALHKDEVNQLIHKTLTKNNFNLIPGARDGVDYIHKNHRLRLVTGRSEKYRNFTEKLLEEKGIHYEKLIFSPYLEKHQVDFHFDLFVEDSVDEAVSLSHARGVKILLFNQPWNAKTLNIKNAVKRVYNWDEILAEIN